MTAQQSVADTLRKAADLIEKPGAWTQGEFARARNGNPIGPMSGGAVCWCAEGAFQRVAPNMETVWDAAHALQLFIRKNGIYTWNDAPGRTQAEVVAALRAAADASEAP